MCGITGFIDKKGEYRSGELEAVAKRMTDSIQHRGPDAEGHWFDEEAGVVLGHRRLSILDLSSEGSQPMVSSSGRFVISFNGEIYNYQELKEQLTGTGSTFRGHSDTEVMLAAIEQYGIESSLQQMVGMFAFALWDREERRLVLARDRVGEKPLYYGWIDDFFWFGSELKALKAAPFSRELTIDRRAIRLLLTYNCIPAPFSIYEQVNKLLPGHYLVLDRNQEDYKIHTYWDIDDVYERAAADRLDVSDNEAIELLEATLTRTVEGQMLSDVPLGAFLSGGIDSSTVVALMQKISSNPVKTYTIGYHNQAYNEADHARAVAAHLGTDHTELFLTEHETREIIPKLSRIYDEPFSDSSQIPTYLVSKLARTGVTVSLSGDGGDEVFGGYNRHVWAERIYERYLRPIPPSVRKAISKGIQLIPPAKWDITNAILPKSYKQRFLGYKLHKFAKVFQAHDKETLYRMLITHWEEASSVVLMDEQVETFPILKGSFSSGNLTETIMKLDLMNYLPDDILVKVDRASMHVGLESRTPFLDHRLIELAWRFPRSMKIRNGESKWLLRQVLYQYVPQELIERPKMGFGVPIGEWLRGPLKEWAYELLDEQKLNDEGYLDAVPILKKWEEHLSGKTEAQHELWDVLMFQMWLKEHRR
ncbi:asparagine synthase (glutamine-hydrolyzing) [Thalassobacillus hwangdonensis]|uniref:asparagine synthase (glutamine-hydrolyzing) n=1 Tax=Thalassobacillus hwangdonensis TaxID=546108 RepID=A0ABW3L7R8_9BACI